MDDDNKLVRRASSAISVPAPELVPFFERCLALVREEMRDNPYIEEALRVLPVGGFRSAIGSFWNAVVDDLRNKIIARSVALFNKSVDGLSRKIATYEDFQNYVNDDQLIEGAFKIGVIGWEASKVLKHAKETRHIFDGHPRSSDPTVIKVLAMMEDCARYVLNEAYPPGIIDIDDYLTNLGEQDFDRNAVGVENAIGDLPEVYKNELVNRLFSAYVHPDSSSVLRSNVEFVAPLLWQVLPKTVKLQIVRRVDQEIPRGIAPTTEQAFSFVRVVNGGAYLSTVARKYVLAPLVQQLEENLDNWSVENKVVRELLPYASLVPAELMQRYVSALTHTYVGRIGQSYQYARTDFFANEAAAYVPTLFQSFDDRAAEAFVATIRSSTTLRERISHPQKLQRLRSLGNIVLERVSANFVDRALLEALVREDAEETFKRLLTSKSGKTKRTSNA
jgi:hypothetical protein